MPRIGRRAKAERTRQIILGTISFLAVAAIGTAIGYHALTGPKPINDRNLCPADGPKGHYVVLLDKTDPLTFTQKAALQVFFRNLIEKRVPEGYLVSVFALGADYRENAEPLVELCNPGTESGRSETTSNLVKLRRRYEERFARPLQVQIDSVLATEPAKTSPIFEMLQLVSINGFRRTGTEGEQRLIVVSDMLHNTDELSMFRTRPDFPAFYDSGYGSRMRLELKGVNVELHYLMNYPGLQTKRNAVFWETYFEKAGARLAEVRTLEG